MSRMPWHDAIDDENPPPIHAVTLPNKVAIAGIVLPLLFSLGGLSLSFYVNAESSNIARTIVKEEMRVHIEGGPHDEVDVQIATLITEMRYMREAVQELKEEVKGHRND